MMGMLKNATRAALACMIASLMLIASSRMPAANAAPAPAAPAAAAASASADDILARSLAVYASLKSYADTGVVVSQFAANASYRHTFKTAYRAPRQYMFDFTADKRSGGARLVMWCDGSDFQSWSSALGTHDTYPRGSNTVLSGFAASASPTSRSILLITGVLFAGSGLISTLNEFSDYSVEGTEEIGGRRCHKLVGVARSMYQRTQRVTNVRRAIIWIDAETLLVRQVFEDTPQGSPATAVNRTTITLDPQANPTLEDGRFRFAVPSLQP